MGKRLNRTDLYIEQSADFAKPILEHIRDLVHKACPEVEETIKWGFPHFEHKGVICSMAAFKKHCAFSFWKSPIMRDPENILNQKGKSAMSNFGNITSLNDLPDDKILIEYIKEAVELNEKGIKLPKKSTTEKAKVLQTPEDFRKALDANPQATEFFDSFSYSKKKDYIEWIEDAKREATRIKRIKTAVEWISENKSRNWKYEK